MEEEEKQYTDQPQVENVLRRKLTDYEEQLLESYIPAASGLIDNYTGRSWLNIGEEIQEEPDEEERIFDGTGGNELFIDDFISISKIELLDSQGSVYNSYENAEDELDQYFFYPTRSTVKSSVQLRSGRFYKGDARVKVTGYFTSGELPKTVQAAASSIVARMITGSKSESSEFESENIEGYSYRRRKGSDAMELTKTEQMLLNRYVKVMF